MIVINLYGGPGTGKSTTAAGLFAIMKNAGMSVELVTEAAKELTWEGNASLLTDSLWVLAEQNRRLNRLRHQVEYVVTDSPLLLSLAYQETPTRTYEQFVIDLMSSYTNVHIWLERTKPYVQIGRTQSEDEALAKDELIYDILASFAGCAGYYEFAADAQAPARIHKRLFRAVM